MHKDKDLITLNMCAHYETRENEDEYLFAYYLLLFIVDVTGDINADIADSGSSFANLLTHLCEHDIFILSSSY